MQGFVKVPKNGGMGCMIIRRGGGERGKKKKKCGMVETSSEARVKSLHPNDHSRNL